MLAHGDVPIDSVPIANDAISDEPHTNEQHNLTLATKVDELGIKNDMEVKTDNPEQEDE